MGAAAMGRRREARYLHRLYKEYSQQVKQMLENAFGAGMARHPSPLPSVAKPGSTVEIQRIFTTRLRLINSNSLGFVSTKKRRRACYAAER
jgi:hypothetical protein